MTRLPTLTSFTALLALVAACGKAEEPRPARTQAQGGPAAAPAGEARRVTPGAERTVAVTFDDLPIAREGSYGPRRSEAVTTRLLAELRESGVPAIGFVNEDKLERRETSAVYTALLEEWLHAGMELGNHTFGHVSFRDTPLERYQREVLDGERVTRRLLAERGQRPRFFRHPYLNTGSTLEDKQAFEAFLADHGYQVAPVTIDNEDVVYALAYDRAYEQGDSALMRRIGQAYLEHMRESFAFYEGLSQRLLGREPAQVLMLHANALNADYLDELLGMLRGRGYGFVPIETALRDPAYQLPDTYIDAQGVSWLQRWAVTQEKDPGEEPLASDWVREAAEAETLPAVR
ncbi:MAG TPA: polysaccharide deacetylase family protein [Longimicrobiaceae bacterium]|nr:polysaccharide deacetylase family protein [Longimicrobiaceae bacterium]